MKARAKRNALIKKAAMIVLEYFMVALGAVIMALGFTCFCVPNNIAPGGFSGLASVAAHLWGVPIGLCSFGLCLVFLLILLRRLGIKYAARTVYATAIFCGAIDISSALPPLTSDMLLAGIFGGAVMGIGMGIIFFFGGSTGGTDLIALLLHELFPSLTTGTFLLLCDLGVVLLASFVFSDINVMFYSIITIYIFTKASDFVQEGFGSAKAFYIFTQMPEQITKLIFEELNRGVTYLKAKGGYTQTDFYVILCAVDRSQVSALKKIVSRTDPSAFMILTQAHEILGEGFARLKVQKKKQIFKRKQKGEKSK